MVTPSEPKLTKAHQDSPTLTLPYGSPPVTATYEIEGTITVTAGFEGGGTFSPAGLKWLEANASVSLSGSASVSVKRTMSVTWTAHPQPGWSMQWWFQRKAWYRDVTTQYDAYGANGFQGRVTKHGTTFKSANAVTAALNDYDDRVMHKELSP